MSGMGHRVRLNPPSYVKPFVKRAENDRADAEAISEAAARPSMPSVPLKSVDQQATAMLLKHREMLVAQRTQAINALRGHAAEFGVVVGKGPAQVAALLSALADDGAIPEVAKTMFESMSAHIGALDQRIAALDDRHKANPVSQLLVVGAMSVTRRAKPGSKSASAWLLQLMARKLAAVALANKMARIVWAMMARGEAYRRQPIAA